MNKRHYEHTLPNIRGSLSNTYAEAGPFHQFHIGTNRLRHPVAYAQGRKDILPGSLSQSRYTTDKSHSGIDNDRQFPFMHGKDA